MRLARRNGGFTLTEIAISLFIVALLVGFFMGTGATFLEIRKAEGSQLKLKAIEVALAGYVAVNGRLPCPADGRLTLGREDGGVAGCNNAQQFGVVPWATLGLSEADVLDSWYNRVTYRVATGLVVARGMDMAACDPAGTEAGAANPKLCNAGCLGSDMTTCTPPSAFLQAGKGLSIIDTSGAGGTTIMNAAAAPSEGAAYVLISHGPDSRGAYPANGAANPIGTGGAGIDEVWNANGVVLRASYVDKNLNESATAAHFDDIVLRPSIMRVILRAERGPRAH